MSNLFRKIVTALFVLALLGCCEGKKRVEPHWDRSMNEHHFVTASMSFGDGEVREPLAFRLWNSDAYVEEIDTLKIGTVTSSDLNLWFFNESPVPVIFHWDSIMYVDEHGRSHPTFHYPMAEYDKAPTDLYEKTGVTRVEPGEGIWETILPIEKTYMVYWGPKCEHANAYSERLLPWEFEGKSEYEMHQEIAALHRERLPVKWRIPVTIGEVKGTIEILWILTSPDEDRYRNEVDYLAEHRENPPWVRVGAPKNWIKDTR